MGRFRHESHVVGGVECKCSNKSAHSSVQRLIAKPLPLSPSVGNSRIALSVSCQTNRPHNSGHKIVSSGLILQHSKIFTSRTHICVHDWRIGRTSFVDSYGVVQVRNQSTLLREESAGPVLDDVVDQTSAKNIAATAEPT